MCKLRIVSHLLLLLSTFSFSSINVVESVNPVLVTFDPYVSILDAENRYRYGVSELVPFVAQLATKFSRVFIELTHEDLQTEVKTSRSLSPLAISEYNNMSQSKLEVWLSYRKVQENNKAPLLGAVEVAERLQNLADEANQIFNGTVTTILMPYKMLFANAKAFWRKADILETFSRSSQWGIVIDSSSCFYDQQYKTVIQDWHPNVVFRTVDNYNEDVDLLGTLNRTIAECVLDLEKMSVTTGFIITTPDTYDYNKINMSRLVTTWGQVSEWSKSTGVPVVLSKVFDTPYEGSVQRKTSGWWRLVESQEYNASLDYVFEEKASVAEQVDLEEKSLNFTWLKQETKWSRRDTGVIFSLFDQRRSVLSLYSEQELTPIMKSISRTFSKILVLVEDDSIMRIQILLYELKTIASFKGNNMEVIIMLMPHVQIHKYFAKPIEYSADRFGFSNELITTFVTPFIGNGTMELANFVKYTILGNPSVSNTSRFGLAFNSSVCSSYQVASQEEKRLIDDALEAGQKIIFYFQENEEMVKLGATRMFQQRVAILEKCKSFLNDRHFDETKSLNFVMLHYASYTEFYINPWALQNFVRYWEMLTEWAGSTGTTVIMSNAVDGSRTFKQRSGPVSEVGWWRYQDLNRNNSLKETSVWIDKKREALRVALLRFPETGAKNKPSSGQSSNLDTAQIVAICLLPLITASILVVLGLYVIRRHYQETYMTKNELNDFFLGEELGEEKDGASLNNGVYKIPYDKSRFEIDSKAFSVDLDGTLGSGEFGRVCRGKIQDEQRGTVNVAVKMVNPRKFRKTTLSGLLSEIKVLAHVGKHENITELLGANTADLKNGKVLIFLELCQLGSLENYLQKLNPHVDKDNMVAEFNYECVGDSRYVNTNTEAAAGNATPRLDASLSKDLYRWSQEICNGMAYLATKHVVHADLATRNVLLGLNKEAKICDFGLSRRMYNYTNYVKQQQEPLPWKWMAPEALRMNQFNEKTDVWGYGVTLWEIYSLGETPYPGLSWDLNFPKMLQLGFRLNEPSYNDQDMHSVMKLCWNYNPDQRPTFADLLANFKANVGIEE